MSTPDPRDPEDSDEPRGRLDGVAILYIVGGIPALVAFLVGVFALTHACNIPA